MWWLILCSVLAVVITYLFAIGAMELAQSQIVEFMTPHAAKPEIIVK